MVNVFSTWPLSLKLKIKNTQKNLSTSKVFWRVTEMDGNVLKVGCGDV